MERIIDILIDVSGSMMQICELRQKILLKHILPILDYKARIGVQRFTANTQKLLITRMLEPSITDPYRLSSIVSKAGALRDGGSPISAALGESLERLRGLQGYDHKIVLVTDGDENGNADYVSYVKYAIAEGLVFQLNIVGFGLKGPADDKANEATALTNGRYTNLTLDTYLSVRTLDGIFNQLRKSLHADSPPIPKVNISMNGPIPPPHGDQGIGLIVNNSTEINEIVEENRRLKEQLEILKSRNGSVVDSVEDRLRNEKIGRECETYLYNRVLKPIYGDRVIWLNELAESNAPYDFEILNERGSILYYIECKGTPGSKQTFYLTKNEWEWFVSRSNSYQLFFIRNCSSYPEPLHIDNLWNWLHQGRIAPYVLNDADLRTERIFLTLT